MCWGYKAEKSSMISLFGSMQYRRVTDRHMTTAIAALTHSVARLKTQQTVKEQIQAKRAVVTVREVGGLSPLLPFEPPCNSMSPLIESIRCYFMPK